MTFPIMMKQRMKRRGCCNFGVYVCYQEQRENFEGGSLQRTGEHKRTRMNNSCFTRDACMCTTISSRSRKGGAACMRGGCMDAWHHAFSCVLLLTVT